MNCRIAVYGILSCFNYSLVYSNNDPGAGINEHQEHETLHFMMCCKTRQWKWEAKQSEMYCNYVHYVV